MESGVETRDLRHLRRSLPDGVYRGKVMRLMKRRQGLEIRQIGQHVRRHPDGAIVTHAAMHHPVPDADDRGSRDERGYDGKDLTRSRLVIKTRRRPGVRLDDVALRIADLQARRDPNPLDLSSERPVRITRRRVDCELWPPLEANLIGCIIWYVAPIHPLPAA